MGKGTVLNFTKSFLRGRKLGKGESFKSLNIVSLKRKTGGNGKKVGKGKRKRAKERKGGSFKSPNHIFKEEKWGKWGKL